MNFVLPTDNNGKRTRYDTSASAIPVTPIEPSPYPSDKTSRAAADRNASKSVSFNERKVGFPVSNKQVIAFPTPACNDIIGIPALTKGNILRNDAVEGFSAEIIVTVFAFPSISTIVRTNKSLPINPSVWKHSKGEGLDNFIAGTFLKLIFSSGVSKLSINTSG